MGALSMSALLALSSACAPNVAPGTLLSLIHVESGGNPNAENVNRNETIDRGLAQINSANWSRMGLTPVTVTDPCENLKAAQAILLENYRPTTNSDEARQDALRRTLAAYNVGPGGSRDAGLRYVHKVEAASAYVIPELRLVGVSSAPPQAVGRRTPAKGAVTESIPPTADVFARPAARGRELVFGTGK